MKSLKSHLFRAVSLLLVTSSFSLFSKEETSCLPSCCTQVARCDKQWFLEGRASYFRPEEKKLRKIYSYGWANYQLMAGYSLDCRIDLVGTVNFMQETGKTLGGKDSTKIRVIPLGLEARYRYLSCKCWDLYAGIGPRYYLIKVRNHAANMEGHVSRQGWGGIVETGATWHPNASFFVDFFCAYSYQKMKAPSFGNNIEGLALKLGGLEAGGGLGWCF